MRFERELTVLEDVLSESPLPSTRVDSASVRIDTAMSVRSDESADFDEVSTSYNETPEGRLSKSLQTWMVQHKWNTVEPLEKTPYQPVFIGKLGKESKLSKKKQISLKGNNGAISSERRCKTAVSLRRVPSNESVHTNISLLTCSSTESLKMEEDNSKEKRKRKRKTYSRASSSTGDSPQQPQESKWVELCRRGGGELSRIFRQQAVQSGVGLVADINQESEAFREMDSDEQSALYKCGMRRGIIYIDRAALKRSSSESQINIDDKTAKGRRRCHIKRVLSASAKTPWGKPIDIADLKRERMNRLIAEEQARLQLEKEQQRRLRRHALTRTASSKSLLSDTQATNVVSVAAKAQSMTSGPSEHDSELRIASPSEKLSKFMEEEENEEEEKPITVWKGDRQILEIDLKRELTQRVKQRIASTRTALKRVTGFGDSNTQVMTVGSHDEYPKHVDEDFCHKPRIIQKMRISPHLSGVIHDDIQVRMGRPRYHEIRVNDLAQWDRGQELNRAHRNLKVFNWLHSLRDMTFTSNVIPVINDDIPSEDSTDLELLHVESADEPDVKPLFRQFEVRIL